MCTLHPPRHPAHAHRLASGESATARRVEDPLGPRPVVPIDGVVYASPPPRSLRASAAVSRHFCSRARKSRFGDCPESPTGRRSGSTHNLASIVSGASPLATAERKRGRTEGWYALLGLQTKEHLLPKGCGFESQSFYHRLVGACHPHNICFGPSYICQTPRVKEVKMWLDCLGTIYACAEIVD